MLDFYYDFLDRYVAHDRFEYLQMDTDSAYIAIAGATLDDVIRPEMRAEYQAHKRDWLSLDKCSGRTPGLFKLEFEGSHGIALCSKCYYMASTAASKYSAKGMSKWQNEASWQRFYSALHGGADRAKNRGLYMCNQGMVTYEKEKPGLSAYYDKHHVLPDGVHTDPIEYHVSTQGGGSGVSAGTS